jgi:hypothetical protein
MPTRLLAVAHSAAKAGTELGWYPDPYLGGEETVVLMTPKSASSLRAREHHTLSLATHDHVTGDYRKALLAADRIFALGSLNGQEGNHGTKLVQMASRNPRCDLLAFCHRTRHDKSENILKFTTLYLTSWFPTDYYTGTASRRNGTRTYRTET